MPKLTPEKFKSLLKEIGKRPDNVLEKKYGISRQRIGDLRRERKIPVYKSDFRGDNKITVSACVTKADANRTKRAMKKEGIPDRSKYIRNAIKEKNKAVLDNE